MIDKVIYTTISSRNSNNTFHISAFLEGKGETNIELKLPNNIVNSQLYKMVLDQFFDSAHFAVEPGFYNISLLQENGQEIEITHEGYTPINSLVKSKKIIVRENVNGVFDF